MTVDRGPYPYSEALEQQLALVRHHLLSPLGPSMLQDAAGALLAGSDLGKDAAWRARILAGEVSHAMPFFWTAPIAQAIRVAIETMPAYTFTEDGFRARSALSGCRGPCRSITTGFRLSACRL